MQTIDSSKAAENVTGSDGAIHIPSNPTLAGLASLTRNVAYKTGADDLVMDIIAPQSTGDDDNRRYPTVVFVQGSAWTTPHRDYEIPQLSALAREGFVVATVNHRDASSDPHDVFPAYLEDVKAAIRYLRANARQWHVNPDRLGIWGTSSGGNTSLLVGLTADDPRYEDGTNADESDAVKYVVSCFPPTDMLEAVDAFDDETADTVVPYHQSVKMRDRLVEHGVDAQLVLVDDAEHEYDFWSQQVFDVIFDFIRERS